MPASLNRTREADGRPAHRRNKGLVLTMRLIAYDNGMLTLDGAPLNDHTRDHDRADAWLVRNPGSPGLRGAGVWTFESPALGLRPRLGPG